ncbi:hypothetical protein BpHYR1_017107 [Brachionus plicatilis]|uniref:Uncharacterized protein n=1 Tax=Brachionus plicatilis TaxID=10195 RepID=A0A3M7PL29_BRAPC|nr:hypothetical protein BpHYR1_017107 [Brachionus plicatilis]
MKVYSVELKRLTYEQVVEIFTEFQSSDQNHSERIEFPKSAKVSKYHRAGKGKSWICENLKKIGANTMKKDPQDYSNLEFTGDYSVMLKNEPYLRYDNKSSDRRIIICVDNESLKISVKRQLGSWIELN